jgi:hypothetical protein
MKPTRRNPNCCSSEYLQQAQAALLKPDIQYLAEIHRHLSPQAPFKPFQYYPGALC